MHLRRAWIVLATLAAFTGQAAVVYKWTASDGVIHYSDQPVPGAQKIYTATSLGTSTEPRQRPPTDPQGSPDSRKEAPGLGYTEFSITSPTPEQSFFGDQTIGVNLVLNPGLKPDHTVTWHLNGQAVDGLEPTTTQFSLPPLDRGTYALTATVTDQQTGQSRSSGSITFYVHQPSALSPQHRKP